MNSPLSFIFSVSPKCHLNFLSLKAVLFKINAFGKFYFINIFNLYKTMFKLKINSHVHILDFSSISIKRPDCVLTISRSVSFFTFQADVPWFLNASTKFCITLPIKYAIYHMIIKGLMNDIPNNHVSCPSYGVRHARFKLTKFKNFSWFWNKAFLSNNNPG